jgi:CubicO group peptidase (beta-lactamase class C family)
MVRLEDKTGGKLWTCQSGGVALVSFLLILLPNPKAELRRLHQDGEVTVVLRTVLMTLVAALMIAVPCAAQTNSAATTQVSIRDANVAARAFMREQIAAKHIPGAQIAVVRNGRIIFSEAFGVANIEHQVAVMPDTVFPINSATKSFTGVAAMQLVEAGKLDLDAPVSRYIGDLPTT